MTHKLHPQSRARARLPLVLATGAVVVLLPCLVATLMCAAPARAGTILKGIDDPKLLDSSYRAFLRDLAIHEMTAQLDAQVVRADLKWADLEPQDGVFDEAYLQLVSDTIDKLRQGETQVMVMVWDPPRWAQSRAFWNRPPPGYPANLYFPFYPVRLNALPAFQAFAQHLAEKLKGRVMAYECWCEPNLWGYIYPQRTSSDAAFAAHRYAALLGAFYDGIKVGDPAAQVVAGATAPAGRNDRLGTSPQRFARVLKASGAEAHFDAYSHHPYAVGGTKSIAPESPPADPAHSVVLGNLSTLLDVFPDKPYYLSEYGYNTSYSVPFGVSVDQVTQARYLRRAYAYASRFPQVKLLVWFPRRDLSQDQTTTDKFGVYSGLRTPTGAAKRSWYVYAGGNHLTIEAPGSVKAGAPMTVRGRLTCDAIGAVRGKALAVQTRRWGTGWRTVATIKTGDDGACSYRLWPGATASFRLNWRGVVTSPSATVTVY